MKNRTLYIINSFPNKSETFIFKEFIFLNKNFKNFHLYSTRFNKADSFFYGKRFTSIINDLYFFNLRNVSWLYFLKYFNLFFIILNDLKKNNIKRNGLKIYLNVITIVKIVNLKKINQLHAHWPSAHLISYYVKKLIPGISLTCSVHAHEVLHENDHFELVLPLTKKISFCNNAALIKFKEIHPKYSSRCYLNYHGVDTDFFNADSNNKNSGISIISIGRVTATKGFERLLSFFKKSILDLEMSLTIVGSGNKEIEEKLSNFKHQNYNYIPWLNQEELKEQLSKSTVFCLLCDINFHDGIPNVLVEAMSMSKVCIVSDLPSAKEIILHGDNGFLIDINGDYNKQIFDILYNFEKGNYNINEIGEKARKTVMSNFDSDYCINEFKQNIFDED